MCAEPDPPAAAEVVGLIVVALFELWFLCCIWDALRKGWLEVRYREGVYRRDDPVFFWLHFVWIVLLAVVGAFCLLLYLSQRLQ
jgi:hypothetical protein